MIIDATRIGALNQWAGVDIGVKYAHVFLVKTDNAFLAKKLVTTQNRREDQLADLAHQARQFFFLERPLLTAIEEPPLAGSRNVRVALQLSMTAGVMVAARQSNSVLVPVSVWKMETVGRGNASKSDVAAWLASNYPLAHAACGGDQNFVDAACLAYYAQSLHARAASISAWSVDPPVPAVDF